MALAIAPSIGCAVLAVLAGCAGSAHGPSSVELTQEGKLVRVFDNEREAASCQSLGEVVGPPPYLLPNDGLNRMKNRTGALGGNGLLVTNGVIGIAKGEAYRC